MLCHRHFAANKAQFFFRSKPSISVFHRPITAMLTLTAAESVRDSSCLILPALAAGIQRAIDHAAPENLPSAVCDALRQHARLDGLLDDQQCQGDPDRYTRHVLYSQPLGLFTVVGLVWRPGQITPVHGHYTWCSYIVLRGAMREEQFQ